MSEIFAKNGVSLPYELENKFYKWISEGEEKKRYEKKIAVKSSDVKHYVENLSPHYEGLSLNSVNYDDRGGITILSVTYGESQFSDASRLVWYSFANGVKTLHIKEKVKNTSDAINAFIASCQTMFGFAYKSNEISVSCSPQIGEEFTWCEATFTKQNQVTDEGDNYEPPESGGDGESGGEDDEEQEETISETGTNVQMSSSLTTINVPFQNWINKKVGKPVGKGLITMAENVKAGKYVWVSSGEYGEGRPSKDGWVNNNGMFNLNNLEVSSYQTSRYPLADVENAIIALQGAPTVTIPLIRVTVTTTARSSSKDTLSNMGKDATDVGGATAQIKAGDFSMTVPKGLETAKDSEGNEWTIKTEWISEGTSYDLNGMTEKTSFGGKSFYEGKVTRSWVTRSYIEAEQNITEG